MKEGEGGNSWSFSKFCALRPLRLENYAQRNISFCFLLSFFPMGPFYNPQHTPPGPPRPPQGVDLCAECSVWEVKNAFAQIRGRSVQSKWCFLALWSWREILHFRDEIDFQIESKNFFPPFTRSQIVCIEFILFLI